MDGYTDRQAAQMTHTYTHTQGHRCSSCSCGPVGCVLHENNRDDSGNAVEKGAITMNDKLLTWAQADREFAQVLLFVKVCVRLRSEFVCIGTI